MDDEQRDDVTIACTLTAGETTDRLVEWRAVLAHAGERVATAGGGLRLPFDAGIDVGELARLVAAEQACCPFFAFTITVDARGTALEVRAPEDASAIVDALFGATT